MCRFENGNKQKIKNLKIIQDRLLFTSSCYRDPFQFFIGYNLLIQIAGSEASSFAVSSEDIDKERLTRVSHPLLEPHLLDRPVLEPYDMAHISRASTFQKDRSFLNQPSICESIIMICCYLVYVHFQ